MMIITETYLIYLFIYYVINKKTHPGGGESCDMGLKECGPRLKPKIQCIKAHISPQTLFQHLLFFPHFAPSGVLPLYETCLACVDQFDC
jgi:hypothetical protein